jgi:phage repressor protein C with HTH and peptisase S24 domain
MVYIPLLTQKDKNLVKLSQLLQPKGCSVLKWDKVYDRRKAPSTKKSLAKTAYGYYTAPMSNPLPPALESASGNLIGQRLKLEMKKQGITSAELAKKADVKTSFLYDIISGKSSNPSTIKLARVAESLDISLAYLVGNKDVSQQPRQSTRDADSNYVTVPRITVDITADGSRVTSQEHEAEAYFFRKSWINDHLGVSASDLRMMYVRGDNMEPTLQHNDIVLVDTTKKTPSPPGIFVCFDGLGLTARRLEFVVGEKRIRLMSDNPQYSTFEREADETVIIGRVVWFAREI